MEELGVGHAPLAQLDRASVYTTDLKSVARLGLRVRVPPWAFSNNDMTKVIDS